VAEEDFPVTTLVLPVSPDGDPEVVEQAARLVRAGRLVAFPTETVYGLGADATSTDAVERIFAAKQRPHSDPLIVHLATAAALPSVAQGAPPLAWALAERFWPGPLTLVLHRAEGIPAVVAAGGPTVGVRVPDHAVARELIARAGVPIAAPSANRFMHTSPTTAAHVLADLDGRVDCVLDAGPCSVGVESTVLDLTRDPPRILRPGSVTFEALRALVPNVEAPTRSTLGPGRGEAPAILSAPGQLERHYAPRARVVVFDAQGPAALAAIAREAQRYLARGERVGALLPDEEAAALAGIGVHSETLGPGSDLAEVSRRLYAALRALDELAPAVILSHTFGTRGLGLALWDRLRRAAGGSLRSVAAEDEAQP
jgi:L-threonylcarbamoyladenylate synthase